MSDSGKRKIEEEEASNASDKKGKKEESVFESGTTETKWSCSEGERDYILRYTTKYGRKDWSSITLPKRIEWPDYEDENEDEDGADENIVYRIVGAIWTADEGRFVAFWGASEDDGHVELYIVDDYEHGKEDLTEVSGVLCGTICPEMADTFDDGSGIDRDGIFVPAEFFTSADLDNLYKVKA